jgi:hypothetical protein
MSEPEAETVESAFVKSDLGYARALILHTLPLYPVAFTFQYFLSSTWSHLLNWQCLSHSHSDAFHRMKARCNMTPHIKDFFAVNKISITFPPLQVYY